jgi:hypothetical protein
MVTLEDLREVFDESSLPNKGELLQLLSAYEDVGEKSYPLGFGYGIVVCELCGYEELLIYPVPLIMPCECGNCGQETSYFKPEETDIKGEDIEDKN